MRRDGIAILYGRLAPRKKVIEHAGQDRRLPAKGTGGRADQVRIGRRIRDVGQRIDVERAYQARVQALEVKHPDVLVQPGHRLQHMPALLQGAAAAIARANAGRDDAELPQFAEVQEIERRNARRDPVRRHAGQLAAREGKRNDIEPRDDLKGESRVSSGIQREGCEVMAVVICNLRDAILYVAT